MNKKFVADIKVNTITAGVLAEALSDGYLTVGFAKVLKADSENIFPESFSSFNELIRTVKTQKDGKPAVIEIQLHSPIKQAHNVFAVYPQFSNGKESYIRSVVIGLLNDKIFIRSIERTYTELFGWEKEPSLTGDLPKTEITEDNYPAIKRIVASLVVPSE